MRAIGHPYGTRLPGGFMTGLLRWSTSEGVVSGVGPHAVQFTAPVNPGTSGGPVVEDEGRLVGVVFGGRLADRIMSAMPGKPGTTKDVSIAAPGLNFGVGINEVLTFTQSHLR